jgi:hypothetical protein
LSNLSRRSSHEPRVILNFFARTNAGFVQTNRAKNSACARNCNIGKFVQWIHGYLLLPLFQISVFSTGDPCGIIPAKKSSTRNLVERTARKLAALASLPCRAWARKNSGRCSKQHARTSGSEK